MGNKLFLIRLVILSVYAICLTFLYNCTFVKDKVTYTDYYRVLACYDSTQVIGYKAIVREEIDSSKWTAYEYILEGNKWQLLGIRKFMRNSDTLFIGGKPMIKSTNTVEYSYIPMYFPIEEEIKHRLPPNLIYEYNFRSERRKEEDNLSKKNISTLMNGKGELPPPPLPPSHDEEVSQILTKFQILQKENSINYYVKTSVDYLAVACHGKQEKIYTYDFRLIEVRGYYDGFFRPILQRIQRPDALPECILGF
jgi:predicted nucleic acid-binding protein